MFRTKVALNDAEFDSMVRSLRSYLDVSLEGLLSSIGNASGTGE